MRQGRERSEGCVIKEVCALTSYHVIKVQNVPQDMPDQGEGGGYAPTDWLASAVGERVKSLTTFPCACHRLVCSEAGAGPRAESWGPASEAVRSACRNREGYGALSTSATKAMECHFIQKIRC